MDYEGSEQLWVIGKDLWVFAFNRPLTSLELTPPPEQHAREGIKVYLPPEPWTIRRAHCVVAAVFLARNGHDCRAGLFLDPGR